MPRRGHKISPAIRGLIHLRALEEPRVPRNLVAMHLSDEISHMGLIAPAEDTLNKMISRERNRERDPLSEPWTIGASRKYKDDFRPEIIPRIIKLQKLQMRDDWNGIKPLTIRQAQWVARLHDFVKEICLTKYPGAEYLWIVLVVADMYATWEEMQEIVGEKLDTSNLDEVFFITEAFWDLSHEEWASRYAVIKSLYAAVEKDYRHGRTLKNRNDGNFSGR